MNASYINHINIKTNIIFEINLNNFPTCPKVDKKNK